MVSALERLPDSWANLFRAQLGTRQRRHGPFETSQHTHASPGRPSSQTWRSHADGASCFSLDTVSPGSWFFRCARNESAHFWTERVIDWARRKRVCVSGAGRFGWTRAIRPIRVGVGQAAVVYFMMFRELFGCLSLRKHLVPAGGSFQADDNGVL
jgi:hypothetical protein